jgi:flagellar biosynthesis protein FlhF
MRVRKFTGANTRAVMYDVRSTLGANAVILSTRNVAGGVEILAVAERDMAAIIAPQALPTMPQAAAPAPGVRPWQPEGMPQQGFAPGLQAAPVNAAQAPVNFAPGPITQTPAMPAPAPAPLARAADPVTSEIQSIKSILERQLETLTQRTDAPANAALATELKSMRGLLEQQLAVLAQAAMAQKSLAAQARMQEAATAAAHAKLAKQESLADEVKSMRALLQRELAQLSWSEAARRSPLRADMHRRLLQAGFAAASARELIAELPDDIGPQAAQAWLQSALERRVATAPEDEVIRKGGVYALVGPTGVGKTTTAAKLAARCAVRFGARRIALVTTDGYRVAAHDQLRAYGKILGVPVQAAQDAASLKEIVDSLHERHLVLIDTVGTGQRDPRLAEMLAALDAAGANRLLLVNAAAQAETIEDVVQAWRSPRLAGTILTKIDEAVKLGPALDCLARHGLALHYIANGQRVPEDLHAPNPRYLVHRSLRANTAAALALGDEEYAALTAGAPANAEDARASA